jgi:hypothetical protein
MGTLDQAVLGWFRKAWAWVHSRDLFTWLGHGVLGFILTWWFSPIVTFVAFAYREASDLLAWWAAPEPKRPLREKLVDCWMDLWAPMAGAAIAVLLGL